MPARILWTSHVARSPAYLHTGALPIYIARARRAIYTVPSACSQSSWTVRRAMAAKRSLHTAKDSQVSDVLQGIYTVLLYRHHYFYHFDYKYKFWTVGSLHWAWRVLRPARVLVKGPLVWHMKLHCCLQRLAAHKHSARKCCNHPKFPVNPL